MRIRICVICAVILVFALPFVIDWLIIGNDFLSNISNSDWVGFLGGYVGAIIGAFVSLIGIVVTIRYTNDQNKKDRELQVRPYCSVRYVPSPKSLDTKKELSHLLIGCEPKENNGPRYQIVIYIKNVGLGPALDFDFYVDDIDDGREHYPILMQTTPDSINNSVNLLQPGEEARFLLIIYFNFDKISEDDIEVWENSPIGKYTVKHTVFEKYKDFGINITMKYCDIFQNEYAQTIKLSSQMSDSISPDGNARHLCDIILKETTVPIKI